MAEINAEVKSEGIRLRKLSLDPNVKTSTTWMRLRYRMQPDRTISRGPGKGGEKSKARVTHAFRCNSDGSDR
jgi:hypothetical protein